jgi:hypothetical protein
MAVNRCRVSREFLGRKISHTASALLSGEIVAELERLREFL